MSAVLLYRPNLVDGPVAAWWIEEDDLRSEVLSTEAETPGLVPALSAISAKPDDLTWPQYMAWLSNANPRPWGVWELHEVLEDPRKFLQREIRMYAREQR